MVGKMNGKCRYKRKGYLLDLVGERFGRLVVTAKAEDKIDPKSGKHKSQWYCDCDCGTKNKIILGAALTAGKIRSCGCLRKEVSSKTAKIKISHGKKYNTYDLSGEYGIGWTTNTNKEFYFDLEDYDKIKNYRWHDNGHYATTVPDGDNCIFMQNIIMNPQKGERVDHIKHNTYDNRKKYLRIGTISDNNVNRTRARNNTSGVTGVCFHKGTQKWTAYIRKDGKRIYLGVFSNFDDAVKARKQAEEKYFKEWSYDNSMNVKID